MIVAASSVRHPSTRGLSRTPTVVVVVGGHAFTYATGMVTRRQARRPVVKARPAEGVAGVTRLHAMAAEPGGDVAGEDVEVPAGIETDRGPWVRALVAAGCTVFEVNPLQASRYRERLGVSRAKE